MTEIACFISRDTARIAARTATAYRYRDVVHSKVRPRYRRGELQGYYVACLHKANISFPLMEHDLPKLQNLRKSA